MTPSTVTVAYVIETFVDAARRPADKPACAYRDAETRLTAAVRRDRSGTTTPDGWPPTTESGGGGSGSGSSVERAVLMLVGDEHVPIDRHRLLTRRAYGRLLDALAAWNDVRTILDEIDELTGRTVVTTPTCEVCTGRRGKGNDRTVAHRGTVGDRLERRMDLCDRCYQFVVRTAPAASREGYLPTDEQIRYNEERGRWRMRVRSGVA